MEELQFGSVNLFFSGLSHVIESKSLIIAGAAYLFAQMHDTLGVPNAPSYNPGGHPISLDFRDFCCHAFHFHL